MTSPLRVACRYLQAVAIGDPKDLLAKLEDRLNRLFFHCEGDYEKGVETLDILKREQREGVFTLDPGRVSYQYERVLGLALRDSFKYIHGTGNTLFLALLQQYVLTPKQRKEVEDASRFYNKARVVWKRDRDPYKNLEASFKLYEKLYTTYKKQISVAKEIIERGKLLGETLAEGGEGDLKIKAGPFTLVNTGGFPTDRMKEVSAVVEEAAKRLESHGLGKVCYGDILISNTISRKNVLAFYIISSDEMFIRANVKKDADTVSTVIHELGHRFEHKFGQSKRGEIVGAYRTLKTHGMTSRYTPPPPELVPKPGEKLVQKGLTYVVTKFDPFKSLVILQPEEGSYTAHIPLAGWLHLKGIPMPKGDLDFVTTYASTDPSENFAEMLSHYCMGKLPQPQVELLEKVIK